MKPGRQVIMLSGLIVFGGSLLPGGDALAYGQQWRPVGGLAVAQTQSRSYPRVANIPTFRPPVSAPRPYHRPSASQGARFADTRGASLRYAASEYATPRAQGYRAPYYPSASPRVPVWAEPFSEMAQAWQQVPLYARQFAWAPAEQPWIAAPSPRQPRYGVQMAPRMTGFRPTGPAYAATSGSWRPSAHAASSPRGRYASRAAVYTAGRQPALAVQGASGWRSVDSRLAGTDRALPAAARGHWRPDLAAAGNAWQAGAAFRPAAYGRTSGFDDRTASYSGGGNGFTRDKLPGWVTTYQDTDDGGACTWCGGS